MAFITKAELPISRVIDQVTDGDDTKVDEAIAQAEGILADYLGGPGYDVATILAAAGANRNLTLVKWCKYLAVYALYDRIPDEQVPPRWIKNYDDTMAELRRVADGRYNLNLPRKTGEDGKPKTKFRWGSETRRTT